MIVISVTVPVVAIAVTIAAVVVAIDVQAAAVADAITDPVIRAVWRTVTIVIVTIIIITTVMIIIPGPGLTVQVGAAGLIAAVSGVETRFVEDRIDAVAGVVARIVMDVVGRNGLGPVRMIIMVTIVII